MQLLRIAAPLLLAAVLFGASKPTAPAHGNAPPQAALSDAEI